jgi:prophage regulatory protein
MNDVIIKSKENVLRLKDVIIRIGMRKSFIYDRIRKGEFPKSLNLDGRCVGWLESDVDAWLADRIQASRKQQG